MRLEHRRVLEDERGHGRRFVPGLTRFELVEEIGTDAARVEKLLELHRGQLVNLLLGVVDASLLADPRPDLLHDLLDVHRVGSDVEIGHKQLSALSFQPPVLSADSRTLTAESFGAKPQRGR